MKFGTIEDHDLGMGEWFSGMFEKKSGLRLAF